MIDDTWRLYFHILQLAIFNRTIRSQFRSGITVVSISCNVDYARRHSRFLQGSFVIPWVQHQTNTIVDRHEEH